MLDFIQFHIFSLVVVLFATTFFALQAIGAIRIMDRIWPGRPSFVREWEYFVPLVVVVAVLLLT